MLSRISRSALCLMLVAVGACSTPMPRANFNSDDPVERSLALEESVRAPERADIPDLIELLESENPGMRMLAARHLENLTGLTHGYDFAAPRNEREAAVDRWVEWWTNEQDDPS